jgi:two-component system, OmpR family, sensor kinase
VFEHFCRADASRTRAHGGTGLGLSIVASLAAAHGGSVELDSAPGQGATFRVALPLAPGTGTDGDVAG